MLKSLVAVAALLVPSEASLFRGQPKDVVREKWDAIMRLNAEPVVIPNFLSEEACDAIIAKAFNNEHKDTLLVDTSAPEGERHGVVVRGGIHHEDVPQELLTKFAENLFLPSDNGQDTPVRVIWGETDKHEDTGSFTGLQYNCPTGECVSLVIYLDNGSGDLTVSHGIEGKDTTRIATEKGMLVLMPPKALHHGSAPESDAPRYMLGPYNPFAETALPFSTRRSLISSACGFDRRAYEDVQMKLGMREIMPRWANDGDVMYKMPGDCSLLQMDTDRALAGILKGTDKWYAASDWSGCWDHVDANTACKNALKGLGVSAVAIAEAFGLEIGYF